MSSLSVRLLQNHEDGKPDQGLVVSSSCLKHVFPVRRMVRGHDIKPTAREIIEESELQDQLFAVARKCKAVLCCQVSPAQKAQVRRERGESGEFGERGKSRKSESEEGWSERVRE